MLPEGEARYFSGYLNSFLSQGGPSQRFTSIALKLSHILVPHRVASEPGFFSAQ